MLHPRARTLSLAQPLQNSKPEASGQLDEQEVLLYSICETMVPKLVAEDIPLLFGLLGDLFPGVQYSSLAMSSLRACIAKVCSDQRLVENKAWVDKMLQLYQIQSIHHGLMLVGPSGSGKSTAWRTLLAALTKLDGVEV